MVMRSIAAPPVVLAFVLALAHASVASAQETLPPLPPAPPPPPPAMAPPPPPPSSSTVGSGEGVEPVPARPAEYPEPPENKPDAPFANRGFQLHAGLGYQHAFGKISNDDGAASDYASAQFMLLDLGIGGKIGKFFYLGAYASLAGGGSSRCDTCSSGSAHLGIEAEYFFRPSAKWDPWIGYGLGLEGLSAERDSSHMVTFGGFEFARFQVGVDARLTRAFGIGPYAGLSLARYSDRTVTINDNDTKTNIDNRTTHGWFTLGLRFVIFP